MFKNKLHRAIQTLAQEHGRNDRFHVMPIYTELPPVEIRYAIADETADASHLPYHVIGTYNALGQALIEQYNTLINTGLKVYPYLKMGEPYKSSVEMCERVEKEHTFYFLQTEMAGKMPDNHYMLKQTSAKASNGQYLILNDVFRIVHDIVAHFIGGYSFSGRGEYNGWLCHAATLPLAAIPAITVETVCQTAYFEWGRHLRRVDGTLPTPHDEDWLPRSKRPFAPQKNYYPQVAMGWYKSTIATK